MLKGIRAKRLWNENVGRWRVEDILGQSSQDYLQSVKPSSNTPDSSLQQCTCNPPPTPLLPLPPQLSAAELLMSAAGAEKEQHVLQASEEAKMLTVKSHGL